MHFRIRNKKKKDIPLFLSKQTLSSRPSPSTLSLHTLLRTPSLATSPLRRMYTLLCIAALANLAGEFRLSDVLVHDEVEVMRALGEDDTNEALAAQRATVGWLQRGGAKFHAVAPRLFTTAHLTDTTTGMLATRDIRPGTTLLTIPEPLLLTTDAAQTLLPAKVISARRALNLPATDLLRLFLAHSSLQNSSWHTWVQTGLVEDPEVEVNLDSPLERVSAEGIAANRNTWKETLKKLAGVPQAAFLDDISEEMWGRVLRFVDTHSRSLSIRGRSVALCVPGFELFQIRAGQTAYSYSPETQEVTLYAVQPIARGEQIFVEGFLMKKSVFGRRQQSLGMCLSWATYLPSFLAPPVHSDELQWLHASPLVQRERRKKEWIHTLTLTQPPDDLLNAFRAKLHEKVAVGEMLVQDSEIAAFRSTRDVIEAEYNRMGGFTRLARIFKSIVLVKEERCDRARKMIYFQQLFVLRHHILLLSAILAHLAPQPTPFGHLTAAATRRSSTMVDQQYYRAVYSVSVVAARVHHLNVVLRRGGGVPRELPGNAFVHVYSEVMSNLTVVSALEHEGLMERLAPPGDGDGAVGVHVKALRCDISALLSRAVVTRDYLTVQVLLDLGPGVANADSLLASSVHTRKRGWHGYRLLHAAVVEGDLQMVKLLIAHGATPLPTLANESAVSLVVC